VSNGAPDCPVCQRSNGFFRANGHLQRHLMRARARRSQARARRRTGQSTGPVRWLRRLQLQRSESNGSVTWQAHRTMSGGAPDCPVHQATDSLPTTTFGGWGYKYPNHPTIHCIQVFQLSIPYKSYSIQYKTHQRDQILCQVLSSFQIK
jgi:hypothetical protein